MHGGDLIRPAMNWYEELGLNATASAVDIRKAHRTLSRLLHPDHQMEADLRQAAELQMRRINAMTGVLLNPEQRRLYDASLLHNVPVNSGKEAHPVRRSAFSAFDLVGMVVAAVVITLVAIWLVAGEFIPWTVAAS
jgi:curved DNA-binding protein CbpA